MTINQCAPGCGLQRLGEGATAPFSRGKIGNFCWRGGGGIAFILRPGGRIQLLRPVTSVENMTIRHRTEGFGLKRLGDGVAATLFEGIWDAFFFAGEVYTQF